MHVYIQKKPDRKSSIFFAFLLRKYMWSRFQNASRVSQLAKCFSHDPNSLSLSIYIYIYNLSNHTT
ncbi:hypothetical protein Hanom_Chr02g00138481 [Helianthus anomalus]